MLKLYTIGGELMPLSRSQVMYIIICALTEYTQYAQHYKHINDLYDSKIKFKVHKLRCHIKLHHVKLSKFTVQGSVYCVIMTLDYIIFHLNYYII